MNWYYGKHCGGDSPNSTRLSRRNTRRKMVISRHQGRRGTMCSPAPNIPQAVCLAGAIQQIQQCEQEVYASVYSKKSAELTVALPGDHAAVVFDGTAKLSGGMTHDGDTLCVSEAGDYEINVSLSVSASAEVFAAISVQADEKNLKGGVFSRMMRKSAQTVSGAVIATLKKGAKIRVAATSAAALSLTVNDAKLCVKKIGQAEKE